MSSNTDLPDWKQIGLPDPEALVLEDEGLLDEYAVFCSSFEITNDGNAAILSMLYGLEPPLTEDSLGILKVLSAVIHPEAVLAGLDNMKEAMADEWGEDAADEETYEEEGFERTPDSAKLTESRKLLDTLRNSVSEFRVSADYVQVGGPPLERRTLGCFTTIDGSPGGTFVELYKVYEFNRFWAVLVLWPDTSDLVISSFPRICGFYRLSGLCRNLVEHIDDGIESFLSVRTHDIHRFEGFPDDLFKAWLWFSTEDDDWKDFFLQFSDDELDIIRQEYGTLANFDLQTAVTAICLESDCERGQLVNKFRRPETVDYISGIARKIGLTGRSESPNHSGSR